jgi:hypothetical protein
MAEVAGTRVKCGNFRSTGAFPIGAPRLPVEVAHNCVGVHSEYTMNIFYIIGVVVVVIVVAGFLGVHL